jgi:hypothetical protein
VGCVVCTVPVKLELAIALEWKLIGTSVPVRPLTENVVVPVAPQMPLGSQVPLSEYFATDILPPVIVPVAVVSLVKIESVPETVPPLPLVASK